MEHYFEMEHSQLAKIGLYRKLEYLVNVMGAQTYFADLWNLCQCIRTKSFDPTFQQHENQDFELQQITKCNYVAFFRNKALRL